MQRLDTGWTKKVWNLSTDWHRCASVYTFWNKYISIDCLSIISLTLCQTTNFRLFQTGRVCRQQFQIECKWQKVLHMGRKHCGKRRNCSLRGISPFPKVFSKDLCYRHVKTELVWERVNINSILNTFPNKRLFLRVCSTSLLKTLWKKEKFFVTSYFFFPHSILYLFWEISAIQQIRNRRLLTLSVWMSLIFVVWERVNPALHSSDFYRCLRKKSF